MPFLRRLVLTKDRLTGAYGDFRDDLISQGYAVIRGAISPERAQRYQQRALAWLGSFDPSFDAYDSSTWQKEKLPIQTKLNTYENYGVVHERFMWEARQEQNILDTFTKIWGTDELLVSFDSLNVTLPNFKQARTPWPHVDQAPRKRGLHCVQGIINLSHAGEEDGSLVVVPGSHALVEEFFDTMTDSKDWEYKDNRYFSEDDMQWFTKRGLAAKKVLAEPGDLIVWDSRTIHWGGEPTEKSDVVRTVIYAAYAPASMASDEAIAAKQQVFRNNGATTHWPHDNVKVRDMTARFTDGSVDPRNRSEPLEEAERTDKLLKLAGMKPY